ncbi:unnamed protein product [Eruca vesicaria subsp. sativa]|uniref:Uncharacterized protein n=1 Tax=Eruca vesicaria subsp. sativa TaxID=29727 RepID=A0ABC8K772_ERUVS|nr:unnamed protein product [Eruca vesicaria subsp. sativa]
MANVDLVKPNQFFIFGAKEISNHTLETGREKSPGLKILWVWTLGTAAILVASVVRTRMHDMESMMNQEQNNHITAAHSDVTVLPESVQEIAKELK